MVPVSTSGYAQLMSYTAHNNRKNEEIIRFVTFRKNTFAKRKLHFQAAVSLASKDVVFAAIF